MTVLMRCSAWLLAAAVTFATLGPPDYRPHSSLGQDGEHSLAFILIGLTFGLAYPRHRLLTMVAAIGALELAQLVVPGRHARLEDFLVDALAASAGLGFAVMLRWITRYLRIEAA